MFPWQKSGIWKLQFNSIILSCCGKYFIIPLPSMLFKRIHLKYSLLCSRRKPPKGMQTRTFRNAPRCKCRLCSSFSHSFRLQTWRLPDGDLCSAQQPSAAAVPPHSCPASFPISVPCVSTSCLHPSCLLLNLLTPLILLRNNVYPPTLKHQPSPWRASSNFIPP